MNDSIPDDETVGEPYTGINPSQGYYVFQAMLLALVMVITILGNVAVSIIFVKIVHTLDLQEHP